MTSVETHDDDELHLYFLGNSYTSSHHLPQLTKQALTSGGGANVAVESHNPPGMAFAGHLKILIGEGSKGPGHRLHRSIVAEKKRKWNWIILQNQSQVPGFIQDDPDQFHQTVEHAKRLCFYSKEHNPGAKFMFMMTWGRRKSDKGNPHIFPDFLTMQAKLTAGYLHYVRATSTPECPTFVAPCGLVFETIYQDLVKEGKNPIESGSLFHELFAKDGHHPSLAGSYVAAVTLSASLTGKDATELLWKPDGLNADVAAKLRDAVSRTIQETIYSGLIRYPWQKAKTVEAE